MEQAGLVVVWEAFAEVADKGRVYWVVAATAVVGETERVEGRAMEDMERSRVQMAATKVAMVGAGKGRAG